MDIIEHPACTEVLGPPSDINDGSCENLPIATYEDKDGPWCVSFWKPSADELAVLNDGGTIAIHIRAKGRQHPVIGLSVDEWKVQ